MDEFWDFLETLLDRDSVHLLQVVYAYENHNSGGGQMSLNISIILGFYILESPFIYLRHKNKKSENK